VPRQVRDATAAPPPLIEGRPRDVCDDVAVALGSPFIDGSGISVTVDGSRVFDLNSLIAISLAKALASNVPGVGYRPVQLRVGPPPRADD